MIVWRSADRSAIGAPGSFAEMPGLFPASQRAPILAESARSAVIPIAGGRGQG
jgi:hypothetical protein